MLTRTCPRCGKSAEEEPFVGSFCRSCFVLHHVLFQFPELRIQLCSICDRYRLRGEWRRAKDLELFFREKIKTSYPLEGFGAAVEPVKNGLEVHLRMVLSVHGAQVPIDRTFRVGVEKVCCPECLRQSGGYHEGILQIRGDDPKTVEMRAEALSKKIRKKTFISKVEKQKTGVDIWVGDQKVLFELLSGTNYTLSKKLAGERAGKRLYRSTLCIHV